ncbi:MAG: restriction endonuclease subunit S [Clostridia bacterium]|nr:restriction endonuclease subunit S [Clostridia bacterium]
MNERRIYKFEDIFIISSGLSKNRKDFGFGFPFLTFKDVFYNYFLPAKLENLANTNERERKTCSIEKGDLFLTRTSETQDELGMSSVALKDYKDATFNGFTKRLRIKDDYKSKIDFLYLGYYMRSSKIRNQIASLSAMTTRASLNSSMINSLELSIPQIEVQKKIGCILFSLDNKVENNRKTAEKLEEIAQAIFKRWFVDFEFPNEDGEPYKSSGGEMVYCEELGKDVPKGWEVTSLIDMAEFVNGLALKRFPPKNTNDELKVLKIKELGQGYCDENSDLASREVDDKYIINAGDLIFSWSGSLMVKFWTSDTCFLNQHLFNVLSKEGYNRAFLYLVIHYFIDVFRLIASSKATTMGHIKRSDLENSYFPIDKDLVERFNDIIMPTIEKMIHCGVENERLQKVRDALLPKLMSGEIEV